MEFVLVGEKENLIHVRFISRNNVFSLEAMGFCLIIHGKFVMDLIQALFQVSGETPLNFYSTGFVCMAGNA